MKIITVNDFLSVVSLKYVLLNIFRGTNRRRASGARGSSLIRVNNPPPLLHHSVKWTDRYDQSGGRAQRRVKACYVSGNPRTTTGPRGPPPSIHTSLIQLIKKRRKKRAGRFVRHREEVKFIRLYKEASREKHLHQLLHRHFWKLMADCVLTLDVLLPLHPELVSEMITS